MRFRDIAQMREALARAELTLFHLEILLAIEVSEGETMFDIMGRGMLHNEVRPSTTAKAIQRLAEGTSRTPGKHLVKREASAHNANAQSLYLTPAGKEVLSSLKKELNIK